jgi:hypothetical protein
MVVFDGNARSDSSFNHRKIVEGSSVVLRPVFRKLGGTKLHLGDTGMRDYDLPAVVKFLEIHGAISTTFCLELGKETDHQVRANARSGFNSLTWMRLGSMNPIILRSGYPLR